MYGESDEEQAELAAAHEEEAEDEAEGRVLDF